MNRKLFNLTLSIGTVIAFLGSAGGVSAQIITSDPSLPPTVGKYFGAPGSMVKYDLGLNTTASLNHITVDLFKDIVRMTSGADEIDSFTSTLIGDVSVNGSPLIPVSLTGPVKVTVFGKAGMTTGTFNTQISSLDFTGVAAGHKAEIMLDPILPTTGQTSITDVGGGLFMISSFFDIFTELSLDGGPFASSNGAERLTLMPVSDVPEPGSVALLVGLGVTSHFAVRRLRRRKK